MNSWNRVIWSLGKSSYIKVKCVNFFRQRQKSCYLPASYLPRLRMQKVLLSPARVNLRYVDTLILIFYGKKFFSITLCKIWQAFHWYNFYFQIPNISKDIKHYSFGNVSNVYEINVFIIEVNQASSNKVHLALTIRIQVD